MKSSNAKEGPGGLTSEDLKVLKAPFSKDHLGVKVQSLNKERTRAMLVLYLQHTDVQNRIEQVDPAWKLEILGEEREGESVFVRARLTIKNVNRENVGEGGDPKAAYSDALKRCAMLFGVGRYLYDSELVWTEYNEAKDRYRQWTIEDYEKAAAVMKKRASGAPAAGRRAAAAPAEAAPEAEAPAATAPNAAPAERPPGTAPGLTRATRPREQLNRILMSLYRPYLTKFPETRFVELLQSRYGVGETRLMSLEQVEDLVKFMEERLKTAA